MIMYYSCRDIFFALVREIRKVQALIGERSTHTSEVVPKHLSTELGIGRGDFVRCHIERNQLIVERL